ncbi:MAG: hypothetical protein QNK23_00035 [Crocinitomicaceae bacterium]|nr:hypothetical protein [Crocinitomicaceae bacterium]
MENLKVYKQQIKEIEGYITKLEKGELMLEELVSLEKLTRELHEKSIILKYKAFENEVGGANEPVEEEIEEKEAEPAKETVEEEDAAPFDFAIFDEKEEDPIVEPAIIPEPEPIADIPAPEVVEEVQETIVEEIEEEAPEEVEEPTPVVEKKSNSGSFWDQISIEDNGMGTQFSDGKIDTLVGAFGLNEKLRYINDLFDGSSEHFGDAIKLLDSQDSLNDAKEKVNGLADEHEWDPEEESVVEFITILNRRYA